MKQLTKQLLTLGICLTCSLLHAQTPEPFWSENFSNNIPAQWTTADASGQGVIWKWCSNNIVACAPVFEGQDHFKSTTALTGFVHVNSDEAGLLPQNHVSRLTTPAINCTGKNEVYVKFESHIGAFESTAAASAVLRVSTDLVNWHTFEIFPQLTSQNTFSANPEISILDISANAAGQANVYLQWQWTGNFEYAWCLDDIELYEDNPTAPYDLSISDFFYPVSNFATPASQIASDTFGFFIFLSNRGLQPMTNIQVKAEVENNITGAVLFADSILLEGLEAGYLDSIVVMPNTFTPELPEGEYFIRYSVTADSVDLRPGDNTAGSPFIVNGGVFSKEKQPQTATRPAEEVPWNVGNYYVMSGGALDQYKAMAAEFAFATDPDELNIADVVSTIYLLKLNDDVPDDFTGFDQENFPSLSTEWIGYADYNAPAGLANGQLQQVELLDLNSGETGILLEPGARYFLMAGYPESARKTNHAFNTDIKYLGAVSTVVYSDQWYLGGFGEELAAVMRMQISLVTTTDEEPLPESTLQVFPNPAGDFVNLALQFDAPTDVTITIADINGRVINLEDRQGVTRELCKYELSDLASGVYLARIATNSGTKTLQFVVQR